MIEIEVRLLRELAVEHLPKVKAQIESIREKGENGLAVDFWLQKAANFIFDRGGAIEDQAAHLLELTNMFLTRDYKVIPVFCCENGEKLESRAVVPPQTLPDSWATATVGAARMLCRLSGRPLPNWLHTTIPDAAETSGREVLADSRTELASSIAPAPMLAAFKHKLRTNSLDAPIKKAMKKAGAHDAGSVFLELRELALDCTVPFTGVIEDGALVYTNDDGKLKKLTKNALGKRIKNLIT